MTYKEKKVTHQNLEKLSIRAREKKVVALHEEHSIRIQFRPCHEGEQVGFGRIQEFRLFQCKTKKLLRNQ